MIYGIIGGQGSGKSILLTRIMLQDIFGGNKVFSNMKINIKDKSKADNFFVLSSIKDLLENDDIKHSSVCIDEANLWGLDSRNSGKKENIRISTELCQQIRKRHINFYYTTQRFGKVDKRLRDETDVILRCEKYRLIDKNKIERIIDSVWLDKSIPVVVKVEALYLDLDKSTSFSFIANPLYDLYDTEEIQKSQYDVLEDDKKQTKLKGV